MPFVPQYQPTRLEPDDEAVAVRAHYWGKVDTTRWNAARILEKETGLAICDLDPLKLHYSWSLVRTGKEPKERFVFESLLVREGPVEKRIGFAYAALEAVDPGRVHDWHVNIEGLEPRGRRYDTSLFEVLLDALPPLK